MLMWGGMGWLALGGIYYASDSTLRRFYAAWRLIWLEIVNDARAGCFERNWHLAGADAAQGAIELKAK
jgi:hypothetical protein